MAFGKQVKGYQYRVLNEREIRAAAGLLFLATFISWAYVAFRNNYFPVKYVITIFLFDLIIRVFQPGLAPSLIMGRAIVSNQRPEFVNAAPKRFAWMIGIVLSGTIFFSLVVFNSVNIATSIICLICLVFLFFETAFGICLGCLVYPLFFKRRYKGCSGGTCLMDSNPAP